MDWPVIGAVSAAVVVAGVVTYEVVVFLQPAPAPVKRTPPLASHVATVERSAYELPGFSTGRASDWTPSFPLIPLIDSDALPPAEGKTPAKPAPAPQAPKKQQPAAAPAKAPASADAPSAPADEPKPAKLAAPEAPPPPRVEQWKVVVTAKASYFNLGGHVDSAGIVDSLASSHLRDALKAHRNFGQLPPDIRTHILTQNINLPKIAPYRGLLGMNDRALEEEQALRFERVASR